MTMMMMVDDYRSVTTIGYISRDLDSRLIY